MKMKIYRMLFKKFPHFQRTGILPESQLLWPIRSAKGARHQTDGTQPSKDAPGTPKALDAGLGADHH